MTYPPDIEIIIELVRELLPHSSYQVARMTSGSSTWVYRLDAAQETLYLRVLPEANASFGPEVAAHRHLRQLGALVPEVLLWQHFNPQLERSLMLTSAIAGRDLQAQARPANVGQVLRAAGRDLAHLHSLAVSGYGWIKRDSDDCRRLAAEHKSQIAWLEAEFLPALQTLYDHQVLGKAGLSAIESKLGDFVARAGDEARLAHGDFDLTHIFTDQQGYTGIIDFGEIRGTHPSYDLGHFAIENQAHLPDLLAGYAEICPLPPDFEQQIALQKRMIALRRAGIFLTRGRQPLANDLAVLERLDLE
jgi:aminoglycoside phosphotransferase (APT) family kinase protein